MKSPAAIKGRTHLIEAARVPASPCSIAGPLIVAVALALGCGVIALSFSGWPS